ncbi:MAG: tetratricopeptide repeat protein [Myxococcota bacterium]
MRLGVWGIFGIWGFFAVWVLFAGAGCFLPGVQPEPGSPAARAEARAARPGPEPDAVVSLNALGEKALAQGDLETARGRFERALEMHPSSLDALYGMARVARRSGDAERARAWLGEVVVADPEHYDALVELCALLAEGGEREAALAAGTRARAVAFGRPEAHALLSDLTGRAPPLPSPAPGSSVEERVAAAVERAGEHPYDPTATLAAARALIEAGRPDEAARWLRGSWWMADLEPSAGLESVALLAEVDEDWSSRRVVPVYTFADDDIRADSFWRMRMRFVWADLTEALAPLLDTVFVPVAIQPFSSAGRDSRIASIRRSVGWGASLSGPPGIVAIFTERPPPDRRGTWRMGEATFLGRHLTVRLDPSPTTATTTLVHEVLHLYGGVHVSPEYPSIMNPRGGEMQLDQPNTRIAHLTRDRRFDGRGVERDVLARVDEEALAKAFRAALALNLQARQAGMLEAETSMGESRYLAARQARRAGALDEHLGDVSSLMAQLVLRQGLRAEAVRYFDLASHLYGPKSARGVQARSRADALLARPLP